MNGIISTINLDMQDPGAVKRIHGKQNDALSRKVQISFYDGGKEWLPPTAGYTMQIVYRKPDGTSGLYDLVTESDTERITAVVTGNSVTAELHPQMFAAAGVVRCSLRFISNDLTEVLETFTWLMLVDPSELSGIPSKDYFKFVSLDAVLDMIGDLDDLKTQTKASVISAVNENAAAIDRKQDLLTAGDNITIKDGVISAAGGGAGGIKSVNDKAGTAIELFGTDIKVHADTEATIAAVAMSAASDALSALAAISNTNAKIPSQASSSNQLADKSYVDTSIATALGDIETLLADI